MVIPLCGTSIVIKMSDWAQTTVTYDICTIDYLEDVLYTLIIFTVVDFIQVAQIKNSRLNNIKVTPYIAIFLFPENC